MKFFRKYHKWLGIGITLFILLYALSGIILNHRQWVANVDVSRNILPDEYKYKNWNSAAIKGTLKINNDSILAYGNVGIWLTDSSFSKYTDFNQGIPKGIDHRKSYKLYFSKDKALLAGNLFSLYQYNFKDKQWNAIHSFDHTIMDITQKQDTLLVLTRSFLYKTTNLKDFDELTIPSPIGYNNKISLFKTLWIIHSGEILGHSGKLFTDFMGLVFIFLSITGLIYFLAPHIIKRKRKKDKSIKKIIKLNRFSLKWHNKLGWILLVFLVITTITGMFLRPPLLIAIMNGEVNKIPGTIIDNPNAWYDKLRRIHYSDSSGMYTFATIDGIYSINAEFKGEAQAPSAQPPISVMGVNVFEQIAPNNFLVGSFEGLFIWNSLTGIVWDFIEQKPYQPTLRRGAPIGRHMVAGYTNDFSGGPIFYDYNSGAKALLHNNEIESMPDEIKQQKMSLWNFALEIHTMRIFNSIIGMFYLLIVPLSGLTILFVLISGFIVWLKVHRKK